MRWLSASYTSRSSTYVTVDPPGRVVRYAADTTGARFGLLQQPVDPASEEPDAPDEQDPADHRVAARGDVVLDAAQAVGGRPGVAPGQDLQRHDSGRGEQREDDAHA